MKAAPSPFTRKFGINQKPRELRWQASLSEILNDTQALTLGPLFAHEQAEAAERRHTTISFG